MKTFKFYVKEILIVMLHFMLNKNEKSMFPLLEQNFSFWPQSEEKRGEKRRNVIKIHKNEDKNIKKGKGLCIPDVYSEKYGYWKFLTIFYYLNLYIFTFLFIC